MKLTALAYTRLQQGQKQQAIAAAERALANSKNLRIRFLAGFTFAAAGQEARAREMIASLAGEVQKEPQAYAKIIEGEVALQTGNAQTAIPLFTDANALLNTWIGRFELGKAYLENKEFTAAQSEFDRCLTRRGEAMALFLEESPTYGYFPPVHYYLGRTLQEMKSPGFSDKYSAYLSIREKAGEDVLSADARKRIP
jgi:tetratricopeptide (TPR) repeat protein